MKKLFLLIFLTLVFQAFASVCLNMIVKDETPVIKRSLQSVKPFIDYWVIVDTGSKDGTQEMIIDFMKDIPGQLHERPWKNFEHNRNEALELAKGKGDYVLFIDADEELIYGESFKLPKLDKDFYFIETSLGETKYKRVQLINSHLNWQWKGVVHEAVTCPEARTSGTIAGIYNLARPEGNRSTDPEKYLKDARVLETALKEDPNNTRYAFYLAQSYKDAGEHTKALEAYDNRIAMNGWDQEVFWSLLQIAMIKEKLNWPEEDIIDSYQRAYEYRPLRAEPLYYLALYHRNQENYEDCLKVSSRALAITQPNDLLFVEKWIYDYACLMEYSLGTYWTDQFNESLIASKLMLTKPNLPPHFKECVLENLNWIHKNLDEPNDTQILLKSNLTEEKHNLEVSNLFTLAECCKEAGELQNALDYYTTYSTLGRHDQETYWALLQIGLINEALNKDMQEIIQAYITAYESDKSRGEALYRLANYQRKLAKHEDAFITASKGLKLNQSDKSTLVENWVYEYGLLLEYALAAFETERHIESLLALNLIFANQKVPPEVIKDVKVALGRVKIRLFNKYFQTSKSL